MTSFGKYGEDDDEETGAVEGGGGGGGGSRTGLKVADEKEARERTSVSSSRTSCVPGMRGADAPGGREEGLRLTVAEDDEGEEEA